MGKRFLCLILAILIAFSAVGCSKEDLGNARLFDAGQTSDADTFEDLTLEQALFKEKAEFFEEVYSIRPELKAKRLV